MRSFLSWLLNIDLTSAGPDAELSLRLNRPLEEWQVLLLAVLGDRLRDLDIPA